MPHPEFTRAPGSSSDRPAGADGDAARGDYAHCCHGGPRWPLAAAAIGGAFWLFPPLGIASLAYVALRRRHRHGEGGDIHEGRCGRGFGGRGFRRRGFGRWSSGNAAFDEARAEAWREMQAEAEAFDDFRRRERQARDRDVYDRFRRERTAAPVTPAETSGPAEGGPAA